MSKNVIINQDKLVVLKEALDEFMVDKNSNVVNRNSFWFILYRGDLLCFDEKNKNLLDDFFYRHQNELGEFVYEYEEKKHKSNYDFDNFVQWLGSIVPYLIVGWISDGTVWIEGNQYYDIENSNELYQLVKIFPNHRICVNYKEIDKEKILGNKGKSMPKFWYHGTTFEYAFDIIFKGLRAKPDKSLYSIKHDKTVFFTSDLEQSKKYAEFKFANHKKLTSWASKPCVIKIDADKIDNSKIVLDYDAYNIHSEMQDDSTYNDRMKDLGLSYDSLMHTNTIKKYADPRKFKKVGYRGIIMPNAIVSVITFTPWGNESKEMTKKEFYDYINEISGLKDVNLDDLSINEAAPEVDEYEIGAESDNPPVGGNGYHINEIIASPELINVAKKLRPDKFSNWCVIDTRDAYIAPRFFQKKSCAAEYKRWLGKSGIVVNLDRLNESANFDSSEIGAVNYSWDFDEDEYQEWLQEAEYENTQESLMEYINDNVTFELEYLDNETYHTCGSDYVDYNELEDMFGSKMQNEILTTCMDDGSGSFETVNLYSDDDVDINDRNSVNDMAMRLLRHGDYFKDCRGFILTNGVVVYTESEHNEICRIPNVNNKFDFIRMGNIRVLPQSIDIGDKPTSEQRDVLRRAIACYADEELYLDIYQGKSSIGAHYIHPDWRYVMGEIDRFYSEGIKPQGNEYYESKNKNLLDGLNINESASFDSSEIGTVMDINAIAKKIQTKGNSSYILTNGEVITFRDHNEISKINGMTVGKFLNLGNIRIGNLGGIELIKKPTKEQIKPLKKHIIEFNGSLFLDIASYKEGRFYAEMICGAEYKNANPNRIINDILAYFDEGIKPQGNRFYESRKNKVQIIENKYDDLFNKANYDLQYFLKQGKEKYGFDGWYISSWMEKTHPEISVDPKDVKIYTALSDKLHKITKLWTDEDNKEENEKGLEQPKENYDIISLAIEEFGLTSRLSQAGYILPDGRLLNFGSDNYRETDHRQIAAVYKQNGIKIWNDEYRYNYVVDFMNHGAIRCDANSGILDMTKEPTNEQFYTIKDFVRNAVDVDIDFTDDKGNTLHSVSYSDARPQVVVADIRRYYEDGIKPMGNVQYEAKNNEKHIVENFDFEVDSSEIDLSSFKKKHELVPNIWKLDGKLDSRIRLKLLDIADDFWKYVNLTWVEPSGIILTGSICNFNWSQYSDIDLHLIVDFDEIDEKTEFVRDYLDAKKNEWNNEHSGLQIMGYHVELYVQNLGEMLESNGIYDLEENDWIKEPNPDDIKSIGLNKFSIKDKAAKIMTIIDDMYDALASTDDLHQIEEMGDDASYLWKKVKNMRKNSLEKNGESGSGNIVYKILRRTGYLDRLFKLSNVVYDKSNSITESKNIIKEYLEKNNNLPLYKYYKWAKTASSCEKARDLAYSCYHYIGEYIKEIYFRYSEFKNLLYDDEFDYEDDEKIETFCKMLEENNLCDHFISTMQDIVNTHGYDNELPSWCYMDFNRVVKNEWCIHFTKDAENIAKYGFTGGTEELDHLAYTNAGQEKPSEGYDFAFLINDRSVDYNEYGDEAVIFRTSGIEIFHYGDNQNQVIFWGPNVKSFIPIHQDNGDWVVYGQNGQVLVRCGRPSEIALWATENLPQYRKQIMTGKNGYTPKQWVYNKELGKSKAIPYPIYRNESVKKYLTFLKESLITEETVADGSSTTNPYKDRWKAEREALKNFVCNFGTVMQSKEDDKNGKLYKVFYDKGISQLIGYNYCLAVQWNPIEMKPKSIVYIRACDKFTPNIRQNVQYDTRGFNNVRGDYDDLSYQQ